jgi:glycosyltransferase involved in cell wall biosynthesis
MKKDIICIAFPAWEGNYLKSTVQLMKELARNNRVMYVDYAYTWKDFLYSFLGKGFANWQRMIGIKPRLRQEHLDSGATISILTLPPVLPTNFIKNIYFFDKINAFNAYFIARAIQKAQQKLDMNTPSVINAFNPVFGVHLAGKLAEKHLIYYCYDEISAANWANKHGARLENRFIEMVDTVIVSSQGLLEKKSKRHASCFLVKNGVDFDLFASEITTPISAPINENYQKTIGYLGSVDERLDYDLIEKTIKATPQYQYLFVGRVTSKDYEKRLKHYKNVVLVGSQPPTTLPAWVQKFDICWIPFIKNELTAGIYPLKINEYLAAGKPVVSTHFSNLSDFNTVIAIADTPGQMSIAFQETKGNALKRRTFAAKNAWRARSEAFEEILYNQNKTSNQNALHI